MSTKDTSIWSNEILEAYDGNGNLKDMASFIPDHKTSKEIIFVGLSPSRCDTPTRRGSHDRLKSITDFIGLHEWSYQNIIPHIAGSSDLKEVVYPLLEKRVKPFSKVIALGNVASKALNNIGIDHMTVPHPSGLNRMWNDPLTKYNVAMMIESYVKN